VEHEVLCFCDYLSDNAMQVFPKIFFRGNVPPLLEPSRGGEACSSKMHYCMNSAGHNEK